MGGCFSLIFGGSSGGGVFANANRAKEIATYNEVMQRMRTEEANAKLDAAEEQCMCACLFQTAKLPAPTVC